MNNSYVGVVYTNLELSSDYVSSIEEQFSRKFDVKLSLSQKVCDYDGIKVDIDGLGVEISFSKERLKSQLIDHILKSSLELIKEKLNGCKIQADEISSIIKERIDNFELNVDVNETGKIISYADGIAQVYGLKMLWLEN